MNEELRQFSKVVFIYLTDIGPDSNQKDRGYWNLKETVGDKKVNGQANMGEMGEMDEQPWTEQKLSVAARPLCSSIPSILSHLFSQKIQGKKKP